MEKVTVAASKSQERSPNSKTVSAREKVRADFLELTAPIRSTVMKRWKDCVKEKALADPEMWDCAKRAATTVMDELLWELEQEVERAIQRNLAVHQADTDLEGPPAPEWSALWMKVRSFTLHHYLPHNKGIFGKLNDPVFMVIILLTLVPLHGVRVVFFALLLLMLAWPGTPDEFQLINYILLFKGTQFLTQGFLQMARGSLAYFSCYSWHRDRLAECIQHDGPGTHVIGLLVDYLGSIALTWLAYRLLPHSRKHGDGDWRPKAPDDEEKKAEAGGRLRHLMQYDWLCFLASLAVFVLLTLTTSFDQLMAGNLSDSLVVDQVCANAFWTCTLYSILSFPFATFLIPAIQQLMTHCQQTGFNAHGACVIFAYPEVEASEATGARGLKRSFTDLAGHATSVLRLVNLGRQARGARTDVYDYSFGDLSRGIWHSVTGKMRREAETPTKASAWASTGRSQRQSTWADNSPPASSRSFLSSPLLEKHGSSDNVGRTRYSMSTHLAFSSVQIPSWKDRPDGTTLFCIRTVPEGSLDAESSEEPWFVFHRFSDFEKLSKVLGPRCRGFEDAPFPEKLWTKCTGPKLEQRRQALEVWLSRVVRDPDLENSWGMPIHDFLSPVSAEDTSELSETASLASIQDVGNDDPVHASSTSSLCSSSSSFRMSQERLGVLGDVLRQGRVARGGDDEDQFKFGDFSRGLLSQIKKARTRPAMAVPEESPQEVEAGEASAAVSQRVATLETSAGSSTEPQPSHPERGPADVEQAGSLEDFLQLGPPPTDTLPGTRAGVRSTPDGSSGGTAGEALDP